MGLLYQKPKTGLPNLNKCARTARAFRWIGRYLSILITLLLNKMTVIEHLGTGDHSLQCDPGYELCTTLALSTFCPVLALSKSSRQGARMLLSAGFGSALDSTISSCRRFPDRDRFRLLEVSSHPLRVRKFSEFASRYDRPHLERLNKCGKWLLPGRSTRLLFE